MGMENKNSFKISKKNIKIHYKNTYEVGKSIEKIYLENSIEFLKNVILKKECIKFKKFNTGIGRTSMSKNKYKDAFQGRWPKKSCVMFIRLLSKIRAFIKFSKTDIRYYYIDKVIVSKVLKARKRVFRAFGRINRTNSSICNIKVFVLRINLN